jgi:hypothetical protein
MTGLSYPYTRPQVKMLATGHLGSCWVQFWGGKKSWNFNVANFNDDARVPRLTGLAHPRSER